MVELDEYIARAVSSPVAKPPEPRALLRLAERHRRRRAAGRVTIASGSAVVLALGTAVVVTRGDSSPHVATTGTPRTAPNETADITRPLLESCTATSAAEGTATGTGKTDPEQAGEVFAVPDQGARGPLAVLLRLPAAPTAGSGSPLGALLPNTTVAGRAANHGGGDQGQSGITWLLADGRLALLYARDLTESDVHALAEAIDAGTTPLPIGLVSLGATAEATWANSSCADPQGGLSTDVEAIHGTVASRYARVVAAGPGYRWDVGDATFLVIAPPGQEPTSPPPIRQASRDQWNALLEHGRPNAPTVTAPPSSAE